MARASPWMPRGRASVTGQTWSTDFPTTRNAFQPTFAGGLRDAFVVKLTVDGSALVYATYLGGGSNDEGAGIAVDAAGQASVTGTTFSRDFPTRNAFQPAFAGGVADAFVARLTADGAALRFSHVSRGEWR